MRLLNDTRLGLRLLTEDKSYTLAALLTLALCIGGNAAIFSMLSALVLRPLLSQRKREDERGGARIPAGPGCP